MCHDSPHTPVPPAPWLLAPPRHAPPPTVRRALPDAPLHPTILREALDYARLYRLIFPDGRRRAELVSTQDRQRLRRRLRALLRYIGRYRFGLSWYVLDPQHNPDYLPPLDTIPIGFYGLYTHQQPPGAFEEPIALLLLLSYTQEEDPDTQRENLDTDYPLLDLPLVEDLSGLIPPLREMALPAPLDGLADMVAAIQHESGSLFLDICPCCWDEDPETLPWDAETVAWLTEDYQRALPMVARIERLIAWVREEPIRLHDIAEALREAASRYRAGMDITTVGRR